jgi:predicted nucleic acid-binding protein
MTFIVVYDADVLYPNTLRDLLIRVAQSGMVQAKWTSQILDEALGAVAKDHPDIPDEKLTRLRELMNASVGDCLVTGYKPVIAGLQLPDPDDRHVLAAAITVNAQVIVTRNLRHFPAAYLAQWDIEPKSPDDFVLDQLDIDDRVVWSCVQQIANSRTRPPVTVDDVLGQLERSGLVESVAELRSPDRTLRESGLRA